MPSEETPEVEDVWAGTEPDEGTRTIRTTDSAVGAVSPGGVTDDDEEAD